MSTRPTSFQLASPTFITGPDDEVAVIDVYNQSSARSSTGGFTSPVINSIRSNNIDEYSSSVSTFRSSASGGLSVNSALTSRASALQSQGSSSILSRVAQVSGAVSNVLGSLNRNGSNSLLSKVSAVSAITATVGGVTQRIPYGGNIPNISGVNSLGGVSSIASGLTGNRGNLLSSNSINSFSNFGNSNSFGNSGSFNSFGNTNSFNNFGGQSYLPSTRGYGNSSNFSNPYSSGNVNTGGFSLNNISAGIGAVSRLSSRNSFSRGNGSLLNNLSNPNTLRDITTIGNLINNTSKPNVFGLNDANGRYGSYGGLIDTAGGYGIPNSFHGVTCNITDRNELQQISRYTVPGTVQRGDAYSLYETSNRTPPGTVRSIYPNAVNDFGANYSNPPGYSSSNSVGDIYTLINNTNNSIDNDWTSTTRTNPNTGIETRVPSITAVQGSSVDYYEVMRAGIFNTPANNTSPDMTLLLLGERYPVMSVDDGLSAMFPNTAVRSEDNTYSERITTPYVAPNEPAGDLYAPITTEQTNFPADSAYLRIVTVKVRGRDGITNVTYTNYFKDGSKETFSELQLADGSTLN